VARVSEAVLLMTLPAFATALSHSWIVTPSFETELTRSSVTSPEEREPLGTLYLCLNRS
jgi:hypothetical protein